MCFPCQGANTEQENPKLGDSLLTLNIAQVQGRGGTRHSCDPGNAGCSRKMGMLHLHSVEICAPADVFVQGFLSLYSNSIS